MASLTCHDIQFALFGANDKSQSIIAFNTTRALLHEADVLVVRKSGVTIEYEVKVSRSDFRADFRKEQKHQQLAMGHKAGPQHFFYACEPGVIPVDQVPTYAGLVHVREARDGKGQVYDVQVVKPAPRLHKHKDDDIFARVSRSLMHKARYHNEAECDARRLDRIKELEDELGELYAHIFGDGGHEQSRLDALPLLEEPVDELFGHPSSSRWPLRFQAALRRLQQIRTQAEAK